MLTASCWVFEASQLYKYPWDWYIYTHGSHKNQPYSKLFQENIHHTWILRKKILYHIQVILKYLELTTHLKSSSLTLQFLENINPSPRQNLPVPSQPGRTSGASNGQRFGVELWSSRVGRVDSPKEKTRLKEKEITCFFDTKSYLYIYILYIYINII